MKIKNILFFLSIIFSLLIFNKSFALEINRIVYNPEGTDVGKEWFEVCNYEDNILDFSVSYKSITPPAKDSNKTYAEHDLNPEYITGQTDLPKGVCAAITQNASLFKENNPDYTGLIFDSSWSDLSNTTGFVGILKDKSILACQGYGDSIVCPNQNASSTDQSASETSSTTTSTTEKIVYIYVPANNQEKYGDIQVLLPEEKIVPALAEVEYTVKVTDSQKKLVTDLDFYWSFGDGGEKAGKDVFYTYIYPGEYTLIASADGFMGGAKARMSVKVIVPEISISEIGSDDKNNFITFKNDTEFDLFLSNFYLNIDNKLYKLPKNLMIAKNKSVKLSGEALGFKLPANNISLLYPNKNVLTTFEKINTLSSSTIAVVTSSKPNSSMQELENVISEKILENTLSKQVVKNNQNFSIEKQEISNFNKKTEPIYLKRLVWNSEKKDLELFKKQSRPEVSQKELGGVDTRLVDWIKNLIY